MSSRPPLTTSTARAVRLGRAAVEAGAHGVLERMAPGRAGSAPGARPARVLLSALMELRGAALKVAQFLSLETDLLPEAVVNELARSCHRVPPMSAAFAEDAVRGEVGPVEEIFSAFDPTPFAAASLGQVHAATTLDGKAVAVKVQYPGMRETVVSDMRLLRRALGLLPNRLHHERLLDEVQQRLLEECDYAHEAQAMSWFAQRLSVEGVSVPQVFPSLSGSGVLTTSLMPGLHLDAWLLKGPGQAARDAAAQRLYDLFMHSMHVLGRLHADPNPGNLLFQEDGHITLLDFGCTRWIPGDYQEIVARIWRAAIEDDDDAAHALYIDMGLFAHLGPDAAWQAHQHSLKPFREWIAIPLRDECFDFGSHKGFVAEGRRRFVRMLEDEALLGIRPEFVLVNRTLYGLYRVFEQLGARVRCQTAWMTG